MKFEQRILEFIRKNNLIDPRGLVLAGVSGGADSMALLLALSDLRHDLGTQLHAVHFNHKFRSESIHDERFVVHWCKQLNIPLTVGCRSGGKIKHLSEENARQMRFQFFVKTAKALKAQSVALAHTQNDLAETVLMRLMRGSGLYGLRAILPKRSIDGVMMVRPLMGINRQDVESYLKAKKVPYCTDATNYKMLYERNKVRHQLLPLLAKEYNPQIINALSDLASTAGEDYEFLSMHAQKQFERSVVVTKRKVKLNLKKIKDLHPAILRLILRKMVEALTNDPAKLGFEHIHILENLIIQDDGGVLDFPCHLKVRKTKEFLELYYSWI